MLNRTTFMERLSERLDALEAYVKTLGDADDLKERITALEDNMYTNKHALTTTEACLYMGISESLLYKMTAAHEIPHFKPRGKMIYFDKKELDDWLLQKSVPVGSPQKEDKQVPPTQKKQRYARRKKSNP